MKHSMLLITTNRSTDINIQKK